MVSDLKTKALSVSGLIQIRSVDMVFVAAFLTGVFEAVQWCVVYRQMTSLLLCGRSVGSENGRGGLGSYFRSQRVGFT